VRDTPRRTLTDLEALHLQLLLKDKEIAQARIDYYLATIGVRAGEVVRGKPLGEWTVVRTVEDDAPAPVPAVEAAP